MGSGALHDCLLLLAFLVIVSIIQLLVVPYIKLERKRNASKMHIPQPQEIWVQDDDLLYIESVDAAGIDLMAVNGKTKAVSKWKDSWTDWGQRLENKVLYFTGQQRQLR
jgi:hypothetical protein